VEQQSNRPDVASTSKMGMFALAAEKSSRAISKNSLIARRSELIALISCLEFRSRREKPVVSAIIYRMN
jgi:hypothetical protein